MIKYVVILQKINAMAISVAIIEDHTEFRQSLVYLISSFSDYSVSWAFSSVEEALKKFVPTEVLLLDINLPGLSGIEAIQLFKEKQPSIKIIMLTIFEDEHHIFEAIKHGADGYILKKSSPNKILDAIIQVTEGGAALTPMVAKQVMEFLKPAKRIQDSGNHLHVVPHHRFNQTPPLTITKGVQIVT